MADERPALRLAWNDAPAPGEPPPPGILIEGLDVEWGPWQVVRPGPGRKVGLCGRCGWDGPVWMSHGTVYPLHQVAAAEDGPGGLARARMVAAPPVSRGCAFRCPKCRADDIYDRGAELDKWSQVLDPWTGQGKLF